MIKINLNNKQNMLYARFMKYIDKSTSYKGCWLWTGAKNDKNYGNFRVAKKIISTHRLSWLLFKGPLLANLCILHKCDNPPCINPDHLWMDTHQANMDDMFAKGRGNKASGKSHGSVTHPERVAKGDKNGARTHPETRARGIKHGLKKHPEKAARGEKQGLARLTEEQVIEIRNCAKQGESQRNIAKKYNVSRGTIVAILQYKTWKHVK